MARARPQVLLIARIEHSYNRDVLRGITDYVHQHTIWDLTYHPRLDLAVRASAGAQGGLPAGLFITGQATEQRQWAAERGVPFVSVGSSGPDPRCSQVSTDEHAIGAMAVEYFTSLGFGHLAYVGIGPWPFVYGRRDGFVEAAKARSGGGGGGGGGGAGAGRVHQLIGDMGDRRRRRRFDRDLGAMLRSLPRPCGILAADDSVGAHIVKMCRSLELRVPDDIAVLGVDDDQLTCQLSEVPLSSIVQPLHAIGYEAARLLHQHIEDPGRAPSQRVLPPLRVAARASTDLIALEDEDVAAALRLINDHKAEPINVQWVVSQLPVARRTLYRKFEAAVGRTILQQIHHVRFQKAKELLAESDLSLDVVARRSGFANARWLADSFRRDLGITPTRFRRQFRVEA